MSIPDETTIPLGRAKLFLLIVGSIAFVAIGFWMFNLPDAEIRPDHDPLFVHGIALLCMIFFGLCGLYAIRKLFDKRPGIRFTKEGIIDHSSGVAMGLIPWSDITGFKVHKMHSTRFLVVQLADPQKYVAKGSIVRQKVNQASMSMCGSPVTLNSNSLEISFDELEKLCETYFSRYGSRNGHG